MGLSGGGGGPQQQLPQQVMPQMRPQKPGVGINPLQQGVQWGGDPMQQQIQAARFDPGQMFRAALFDTQPGQQSPKNVREFLIQQLMNGGR